MNEDEFTDKFNDMLICVRVTEFDNEVSYFYHSNDYGGINYQVYNKCRRCSIYTTHDIYRLFSVYKCEIYPYCDVTERSYHE